MRRFFFFLFNYLLAEGWRVWSGRDGITLHYAFARSLGEGEEADKGREKRPHKKKSSERRADDPADHRRTGCCEVDVKRGTVERICQVETSGSVAVDEDEGQSCAEEKNGANQWTIGSHSNLLFLFFSFSTSGAGISRRRLGQNAIDRRDAGLREKVWGIPGTVVDTMKA
jgi:hypothetical protein